MEWVVWAICLLCQNASFTWVSRARNSPSIRYHAVAATCSNLLYILTLGISGSKVIEAYQAGSWGLFILAGMFYTVFTVIGSVGAHHLLMTRVEKGNRKPT